MGYPRIAVWTLEGLSGKNSAVVYMYEVLLLPRVGQPGKGTHALGKAKGRPALPISKIPAELVSSNVF